MIKIGTSIKFPLKTASVCLEESSLKPKMTTTWALEKPRLILEALGF
jgi:hypothetical protein